MFKIFLLIVLFVASLYSVPAVYAQGSSFVNVVNPVRGADFWDLPEKPLVAVEGQSKILKEEGISATWLVRFDAWQDTEIVSRLKSLPPTDELGIFLEITPSWTNVSGIEYRLSGSWHSASSAFLTGYPLLERKKLIDAAFESFKSTFGTYPQSVGAWYIDSYSLKYLQQKYGVTGALIVADQFTTDSYQIWGQFWSTPYYPSGKNTLMPAQSIEEKLPVVITQWAARDPVNGYGPGVEESTYSVQANDYIDYHQLDISYFGKLIDLYTKQSLSPFGQVVIGLENSYSWAKYGQEYKNQINIITQKQKLGQFSAVTMKDFSKWYSQRFPDISPTHVIVSTDPLNTSNLSVWFMNPFYRAGWFYNSEGSVFRDVRPYTEGRAEQCYVSSCDKLSFATFALHALDDITRKQKLVIDQGEVKNVTARREGDNYALTYTNDAGRKRKIEFMPRDIAIDGKVSSIDSFILGAIAKNQDLSNPKSSLVSTVKVPQRSLLEVGGLAGKFVAFILLGLFIPGFLFIRNFKGESPWSQIFLSVSLGMVTLTLVSFVGGYTKVSWLVYLYLFSSLIFFIVTKGYQEIDLRKLCYFPQKNILVVLIIVAGTFFQSLSMLRSGWRYDFGLGFWGPIGHDGIWHQALIAQLIKQVPPENPGFSGTILSNYHYFYDLLVASSARLFQIPVTDLLYRFYPLLFSSLIGLGTYMLVNKLSNSKLAAILSVFFVYFAGSFGWIVEFIKQRHFGGESAFWVNQPVSTNLNPPFAISLVLFIAILLVFIHYIKQPNWKSGLVIILLSGSLIEFKVYAGIIVLGGLGLLALFYLVKNRSFSGVYVFLGSLLLSLVVFLPQNSRSSELLVFSPFWFIHSMVDFSDRVGWERLSLARQMAPIQGNWFKFFAAESVALIIFIVGNLGMRFIALFALIPFFKKRYFRKEEYFLIVAMGIISLSIPIFFIQKGNPWNTIQFLYYFLYLVAIFTGVSLLFIIKKLPKLIGLPLVILIILLSPINAYITFKSGFYPIPPSTLPGGEAQALSFLQNQHPGVVLTHPFDKNLRKRFDSPFPLFSYETTSYVSAFSSKPSFVEDEIQQEIFQNDYKKRLVSATDFFRGRDVDWSQEFLQNNNIRYIYLPKIFGVNLGESMGLKKIYDNQEVAIFEVQI